MDFDGVDVDFLTDEEILDLYDDILVSWEGSWSYCTCTGYLKAICYLGTTAQYGIYQSTCK